MPEGWIRFERSDWRLSFVHPLIDGSGRDVIVERKQGLPDSQAVHVRAEDPDEIYFEVVRNQNTTASDFYSLMQERLPEMYPNVVFTPLARQGGSMAGSFSWEQEERWVRFFEATDGTYRIILRPKSAVNLAILESVEVD